MISEIVAKKVEEHGAIETIKPRMFIVPKLPPIREVVRKTVGGPWIQITAFLLILSVILSAIAFAVLDLTNDFRLVSYYDKVRARSVIIQIVGNDINVSVETTPRHFYDFDEKGTPRAVVLSEPPEEPFKARDPRTHRLILEPQFLGFIHRGPDYYYRCLGSSYYMGYWCWFIPQGSS